MNNTSFLGTFGAKGAILNNSLIKSNRKQNYGPKRRVFRYRKRPKSFRAKITLSNSLQSKPHERYRPKLFLKVSGFQELDILAFYCKIRLSGKNTRGGVRWNFRPERRFFVTFLGTKGTFLEDFSDILKKF